MVSYNCLLLWRIQTEQATKKLLHHGFSGGAMIDQASRVCKMYSWRDIWVADDGAALRGRLEFGLEVLGIWKVRVASLRHSCRGKLPFSLPCDPCCSLGHLGKDLARDFCSSPFSRRAELGQKVWTSLIRLKHIS
jgi:hypothetical protein